MRQVKAVLLVVVVWLAAVSTTRMFTETSCVFILPRYTPHAGTSGICDHSTSSFSSMRNIRRSTLYEPRIYIVSAQSLTCMMTGKNPHMVLDIRRKRGGVTRVSDPVGDELLRPRCVGESTYDPSIAESPSSMICIPQSVTRQVKPSHWERHIHPAPQWHLDLPLAASFFDSNTCRDARSDKCWQSENKTNCPGRVFYRSLCVGVGVGVSLSLVHPGAQRLL
jgi:hypothetical protein